MKCLTTSGKVGTRVGEGGPVGREKDSVRQKKRVGGRGTEDKGERLRVTEEKQEKRTKKCRLFTGVTNEHREKTPLL